MGTTHLKIFIDNSFETSFGYTQWQKIIGSWKESSLIICGSIEDADVILITLTYPKGDYAKIINFIAHSKKYYILAEKVFVFDPNDNVLGLFLGLFFGSWGVAGVGCFKKKKTQDRMLYSILQ